MKFRKITLLLIITTLALSCKKWTDPSPPRDPRIYERKYCNDPEAVNYNWNFPGQADSTTCFYPSDVFKGTYLFKDSVYNSENIFDSAGSQTVYTLRLIPLNKNKFRIVGFCGPADSLRFTAERSTYRGNADSTIQINDTTYGYGQFFCRTQDTLSGYVIKDRNDSTRLSVTFTVVSDTAINIHRGTAIKQ